MKQSVFSVLGYSSKQPEFAVVELTNKVRKKIEELQALCNEHSLAEARVNASDVGFTDCIRWVYANEAPVLAGTQMVVTRQAVFFDNGIEKDDADPELFNTKPVELSEWLKSLETSSEDVVLMEEQGSVEFTELEDRVREHSTPAV